MRLWSLHPKYLDRQGLLALWREGLLAQKVLAGKTNGYRNHPQLARFKQADDPAAAIGAYLTAVADEAERRDYSFNRGKIMKSGSADVIPVTEGQMGCERIHLLKKLQKRDPERYTSIHTITFFDPHPLFSVISGPVEPWEKFKIKKGARMSAF